MVERLSHAVPGAELAAALASIDRAALEPHDLVTLMRERARQIAHEQGELLADLVAVADFDDPHTPPELAQGGWRVQHLGGGHYLWTSPARHTYVVAPEPIHAELCGPDPPG